MTWNSRIFTCNLAQRSICRNVWTAGNPDRTWASTKRPKKPEAKLPAETLRSSKLGTGSHPFSNNTHLISWWIFMDFPSWHVDFSKLSTARFTTKSLREKQQSSTKGHVFCSSHRCIRFEHWQLTCRQCGIFTVTPILLETHMTLLRVFCLTLPHLQINLRKVTFDPSLQRSQMLQSSVAKCSPWRSGIARLGFSFAAIWTSPWVNWWILSIAV